MKIKLTINTQKVEIKTPFIRLDALLKLSSAVNSGGEAKEAVLNSLVKVNGEICTARGKKLINGDKVEFNGRIYEVQCSDNNLALS